MRRRSALLMALAAAIGTVTTTGTRSPLGGRAAEDHTNYKTDFDLVYRRVGT